MTSPATPDPIDAKRLFLPWVVEERNYTVDSVDILGDDGLLVLEDILADFATPIVTAVNSHALMLAALVEAERCFTKICGGEERFLVPRDQKCLAQIRAAIDAGRGK